MVRRRSGGDITLTVYHKILVLEAPNPDNPYGDIKKVLVSKQHLGIDMIPLYHTRGLNQVIVEFVCSDANPALPKTQKDLDNLAMHLKVVKELSEHRNEPTKHMNHLLQISVDKDSEQEGKIQGDSKEIERG